MSSLELRGFRADLPIGAMAAFGCLRVCERNPAFRGSRLGWAMRGVNFPVLHTPGQASPESLVDALVDDVRKSVSRLELRWSDQIKTATRDSFRAEAQKAIENATADNREAADWFTAFGNELELDRNGKLEPTPFDMSVARQRFLGDAVRLTQSLAQDSKKGKTAAESYHEALFGPWRYQEDQHSLGWDPTTMKLGAFTHKAPTAMANTGVRAAVWLAFESLPLFPCFYSAGLRVRSFQRDRGGFVFYWPVWRGAIGLDALASLLDIASSGNEEDLVRRGVTALYRSERFKPNQYLASFRTPELVFGGVAAAAE